MSDLTWTNSTRKLSDLIPWEKNPRQIKDAGAKRLVESMDQFGQIHAIAIGPGGEIYDGHQRSFVWAACERYGPDFEVDVRVASRPLTEPEREKLVIFLHSGATGSYDWDILSSWNTPTLKSWGLDEGQLRGWNDDAANLREMINADTPEVDYDELWAGMPEFEQGNSSDEVLSIRVHFATEEDVLKFAQLIGQVVTMSSTFIWYPKHAKMDLKSVECADES